MAVLDFDEDSARRFAGWTETDMGRTFMSFLERLEKDATEKLLIEKKEEELRVLQGEIRGLKQVQHFFEVARRRAIAQENEEDES